MSRALNVLGVQARASLQLALQYRADFLGGAAMALFHLGWNMAPMFVVWGHRPRVAGWSFPEALLVIAWFTSLKGLLEGVLMPSLLAVVEHIRKGTLDFLLVKPVDAQLLASLHKIEPWRIVDGVGAAVMVVWALRALSLRPPPGAVLAALALTLAAAAVLYALSVLVMSAAFFVVRVDNLSYLFNSIFDAARWPTSIFRGAFRFVFTFVLPLGLMTTYPALALLGRLEARTALVGVGAAVGLLGLARVVWVRAVARYRSASS